MSLDSSRKFNGSRLRERDSLLKKEESSRHVFLAAAMTAMTPSVFLIFEGLKCTRICRWFTLFVAVTLALEDAAAAVKDWQRSPLRSAPILLFRRPRLR